MLSFIIIYSFKTQLMALSAFMLMSNNQVPQYKFGKAPLS